MTDGPTERSDAPAVPDYSRQAVVVGLGRAQLHQLLEVPADCRITKVFAREETDEICMLVEGDRFQPVAEGCWPPYLRQDVQFTSVDDETGFGVLAWQISWPGPVS